jgi:hypothetical protein
LIKVLGSKSKYDSGRVVDHEDVYDPICKMMGITRDQYGVSGGVPWVDKWIQWAFQKLRDDHLGTKHGRGKWGLTSEGVDKARAMMAGTTAIQENDLEMLANLIAATLPDDTPTKIDSGMYHSDPYIRSLGLKDHPCLGFFSSQSPVCPICPARQWCQSQLMVRLTAMSAELDKSDQVNLGKGKSDPLFGELSDDDEQADVPNVYHLPVGAVVIEQRCAGESACDHCGGMINDGDPSIWIRKLGPDKKGSKMMHPECVKYP